METPTSQKYQDAADGINTLSIHQRVCRHPRLRVIAEPLLWTKLHLDLLRCTFVGPCPAPPVAMRLDSPDDKRKLMPSTTNSLQTRISNREFSMRHILSSYDSPLESLITNTYFSLGDYRNIRLPSLQLFIQSEPNYDFGPIPPVAAYIDHGRMLKLREDKIYNRHVGRRRHDPGFRLARIKCDQFRPDEPLREPCLAALVIALAQTQWRLVGRERRKQARGAKPKVLVTTDDDESFHLYSANVSSAFLNMLRYPLVPPATPQSLQIQITQIPCKPLDTLRTRLFALILEATKLEDVGTTADLVLYR